MSDRNRGNDREREDWARQVPWHYGQRGPYEDYGWEPGESVLPEFRDPSVHEMPYERERFSRQGRYNERQGRPGSAMDAQRRGAMQNPYDYDNDYERGRSGRGYGYERGRSGGYDENRWRGGPGSYGGMYNRDYDYGRGRYGGADYGRGYDEGSWRGGGPDYYGSGPTTWTYTEYWLIPGPFTGRGPRGYQRSDERIKEDVCERLTQHGQVDASDVQIDVSNAEVTLRGTVDSRQAKRMAEDMAESVSGVREVRNELRVRQDQSSSGQQGKSGQSSQQREVGGTS